MHAYGAAKIRLEKQRGKSHHENQSTVFVCFDFDNISIIYIYILHVSIYLCIFVLDLFAKTVPTQLQLCSRSMHFVSICEQLSIENFWPCHASWSSHGFCNRIAPGSQCLHASLVQVGQHLTIVRPKIVGALWKQ